MLVTLKKNKIYLIRKGNFMLYITMLRCRQKEKLACLTHYNNKFILLKNEEKILKRKVASNDKDGELILKLKEITNEILEVKRIIVNIEFDIKDNNYHIEMEEAKLSREASKAKARVMKSKMNKHCEEKLKSQLA